MGHNVTTVRQIEKRRRAAHTLDAMARLCTVLLLACALATAARADSKSNDALADKAAALRLSGRYADARALLEPAVTKDPRALRARLELGLLYRLTGERDLERAVWNRFYD